MRDARRAWQLAYRQYRWESRHHVSQPGTVGLKTGCQISQPQITPLRRTALPLKTSRGQHLPQGAGRKIEKVHFNKPGPVPAHQARQPLSISICSAQISWQACWPQLLPGLLPWT